MYTVIMLSLRRPEVKSLVGWDGGVGLGRWVQNSKQVGSFSLVLVELGRLLLKRQKRNEEGRK